MWGQPVECCNPKGLFSTLWGSLAPADCRDQGQDEESRQTSQPVPSSCNTMHLPRIVQLICRCSLQGSWGDRSRLTGGFAARSEGHGHRSTAAGFNWRPKDAAAICWCVPGCLHGASSSSCLCMCCITARIELLWASLSDWAAQLASIGSGQIVS